MKATQKQITEIQSVDNSLTAEQISSFLTNCSAADYKLLGAARIVAAINKTRTAVAAKSNGMLLLSDMVIDVETEKAYLCKHILTGGAAKTFWVAKSLVVNGQFPSWVANK